MSCSRRICASELYSLDDVPGRRVIEALEPDGFGIVVNSALVVILLGGGRSIVIILLCNDLL